LRSGIVVKLVNFTVDYIRYVVKGGTKFYAWMGILALLSAGALYAFYLQNTEGLIVTGMTSQIHDGLYFANLVFLVGVAAGAVTIVFPAYVYHHKAMHEVTVLGEAFNEMTRGLVERDRVKDLMQKFHNLEVSEKLLSSDAKLDGDRKEAVVLASGIRGFGTLSETAAPEQVIETINEYLTSMVAVVRRHGGIVDKVFGDSIFVIWGIPEAKADDAARAVRAALEMRGELAQLNELRRLRQQPEIRIGIGINAGPLVVGNVGTSERLEYTVLGQTVAQASRVESLTKESRTDLLISETVRAKLDDKFELSADANATYRVIAEKVSELSTPPPVPIYKEAA
jgi:class 3 adenylate cyclase